MSSIARAVLGIVALCAAYVPTAGAQKKMAITVGVMAGGNYSKVSQDPAESGLSFNYHTGLIGGAFLGVEVTDMFSIEPQAFYSVKGTEVKQSSGTGTVKISYVEIPLLGKLWIPTENKQVKPFVFAGPEVSLKVSCTTQGGGFGTASTDCDKNKELKLKSTDFGATVGAGVEFMAGKQSVRIDGRYTHGLANISDKSGTNAGTIKNRALAVTVGLGFPLPN